MSVYCPKCSRPLDPSLEFSGEAGWCHRCRGVFFGPPRPTPGWVLGVLLVAAQATALLG